MIEREWDNEEALAAYETATRVYADMTPAEVAEQILEEAAPLAAYRLIHLSRYCRDERVALSASDKILTHALRLRERKLENEKTDPLAALLDDVWVASKADQESN